MKKLFVGWQDPETRSWLPIGQLTKEENRYRFTYTHGATVSRKFVPFRSMSDIHASYESEVLFPLFADRLLSKNRPEYADYLRWLNIAPTAELDPFEELGRTGGIRATDPLVVFTSPEPRDDGTYALTFFSHGIRYLPQEAQSYLGAIQPGNPLFLLLDNQNAADSLAVALRTEPPMIVGYVPRYYAEDFRYLIESKVADSVSVWVEKVNIDAPIQLRLLCAIKSRWPEHFKPCSRENFTPLS